LLQGCEAVRSVETYAEAKGYGISGKALKAIARKKL
jgi:hypothetical protein